MIGIVVNVGLRASMLAMLAAVIRAGRDDPRYAGKGIGIRFAAFGLPASLLVPALWLRARRLGPVADPRDDRYPAWMDDVWLSMLTLDLVGNVFDLYDRYTHFDLLPHAHGTGALTVTLAWLLRLPPGSAIALASVLHGLLEAQEYASDKAFGFRNVRGAWDVGGDLGAGAVGAVAYAVAYERLVRGAGREAASPLSR